MAVELPHPTPAEVMALLLELVAESDSAEVEDELLAAWVEGLDEDTVLSQIAELWDEEHAQARFVQGSYDFETLAEQEPEQWREALIEMLGVAQLHQNQLPDKIAELPIETIHMYAEWLIELYAAHWSGATEAGSPLRPVASELLPASELMARCRDALTEPLPAWWGNPN